MRNATTLLLCFFCLFCTSVRAQTFIYGVVTAPDGEPLPFATIHVTGTTTGTYTDKDGFYELEMPGKADQLSFSYLGYAPGVRKISQADHGWLDVMLVEGINLREIVVTALGRQRICQRICINVQARPEFIPPLITVGQQTDLAAATVYPNPFRANFTLRTDLWSANRISVQLLNSLGQVVRTWSEHPLDAGEQHTAFSIPTNLPAGPYFLRLADSRGREVTKVIIKGEAAGPY